MFRRARHLRRRELGFLGMVASTLVVIALYLSADSLLMDANRSGWRKVDLDTLQRRIESGELSDREADWYHPSTPEEAVGGGLR